MRSLRSRKSAGGDILSKQLFLESEFFKCVYGDAFSFRFLLEFLRFSLYRLPSICTCSYTDPCINRCVDMDESESQSYVE